ncbi:MAG: DNA-protecting protein DprA [Calditrichaeota bacterium]|nr:DNA-protecting protein DprA [Calditrichota bacterium]
MSNLKEHSPELFPTAARVPVPNDEFRFGLAALLNAPNIGSSRALELVRLFGSPGQTLAAPAGEIASALNLPLRVGRSVHQAARSLDGVKSRIAKATGIGARLVSYWDADYPPRLKLTTDPPALLYILGEPSPLYEYSVAIVGTRAPTEHGARLAFRIAADLAQQGVAVVSGMATGIDGKAHEGALAAGGRTMAVLGTGIDIVYPREHRSLYDRVAKQGQVVSELLPGTTPEPHNFPQRNRIISGVSIATLIVEAGTKSGALITAKTAIEQGRELFAVPGAAGTMRSAGVNRLIKDGTAHLAESAADIIERLKSQLAPVLNVAATLALPDLKGDEEKLYRLLEPGPMLIDDAIRKSGLGAVQLNRLLTTMQLRGLVVRLPGARIGRST